MQITDKQIEKLKLTPVQLKAAKEVFKAMKAAGKLGVSFWDNYGTMTAYNAREISVPFMVDGPESYQRMESSPDYFRASDGDGSYVLYYENLKNFFPGNSDDAFYAKVI